MYAKVMVDVAHSNVDRLFTYEVPNDLAVTAGQRVLIPWREQPQHRRLCA